MVLPHLRRFKGFLPGLPCAQRQPESMLLYQIFPEDASFHQKSAPRILHSFSHALCAKKIGYPDG
ncbi:MAG: hypothetical protein ACI4MP_00895 [Candidatus Ventricola sp.]